LRKIIATEFYTPDGIMSDPKDEMKWVQSNFNEEIGKYEDELYSNADSLMLGRVTYKIFEGYWPSAENNPSNEDYNLALKINKMTKIVFSKTIKEVTWKNSVLKNEINPDDINRIKQQTGKNILIVGSSLIVQQLGSLGLIDEYHLLLFPVILGEGKPLFNGSDIRNLQLKLFDLRNFGSGVVGLFYKT